jgi:hypothetical protein
MFDVEKQERSYKVFYYLDKININQLEKVNLDFDSSIQTNNNTIITISYRCNYLISNITFVIFLIFEYPELYSVDIETIDFNQTNSKTIITSENSIQPFLGLTAIKTAY